MCANDNGARPRAERWRYPLAIFHLSAQVIKRSEGRSVVAAAAYRAAERLIDDRLGVVHSFTHKDGVEHREIFAPDKSPTWVGDRERLWNEVERAEKRADAQLAREVRVALPVELTKSQQLELLQGYIQEHFVSQGMIADLAVHRDNRENPHAHILITMRAIGREGFGNKVRDWNRKETLLEWREGWSLACNRALSLAGSRSRITHLSHAARGLLTLPGVKIGLRHLKSAMERRGFVLDRVKRQEAVRFRNGEAIRKNPTVALQELTYHEAVFTREDVVAYAAGHSIDAEQAEAIADAIMADAGVVFAGLDGRRREVFTTHETLEHEQAMLTTARALNGAEDTGFDVGATPAFLERYGDKLGLSAEQTAALIHVVKGTGKLAVVEGYAGTGKSRMFDGARLVWEKQGKRVLGAALAGKAAEELGRSATLKDSRSLAAWEFAWKNGRDKLRKEDVLIIDEAGMVGTRQMRRVLDAAHKAGAKVVLAGDVEQLQAVEAGSPFHAIGELVEHKASLSMVRRQRDAWQRQASTDLAQGKAAAAVAAYSARGCLHHFDKDAEAIEALVAAWRENEKQDKGQQVALSYRRAHVPILNERLRAARVEMGAVRGDVKLETEQGTKVFGVGDRICFTRNSPKLGVRNGSLGTVLGTAGEITVRLDGDDARTVIFRNADWKHIDHGYAMSVHKSQGMTVDRVHVLASRAFDRHAAYVAMTRHRDSLNLYASREEFRGADVGKMFSRKRHKRLALDYMAEHLMIRRIEAEREQGAPAPSQVPAERDAQRAYREATKELAAAIERRRQALPAMRGAGVGTAFPSARDSGDATHEGARAGVDMAARDKLDHGILENARQSWTAAKRQLSAAHALSDAERLASRKSMSVAAACKLLPETQQARDKIREAAEVRTFWRAAVEREPSKPSLATRLGLGPKVLVRDPVSGEPMTPMEGLRAAEKRVKVAAEDYEHLCAMPAIRAAAQARAAEHNRPLEEARHSLPELRAAYDKAKTAQPATRPAPQVGQHITRSVKDLETEGHER